MKILLQTRFHPNIGGVETLAALLADEWTRAGTSVEVCTDIPAHAGDHRRFAFPVRHRPSPAQLLRLVRSADVVVQINVGLKMLWPLPASKARLVVCHQSCYQSIPPNRRDWKDRIKLSIAARARRNIAAAHFIAREIAVPSVVIPNPYDPKFFNTDGDGSESRKFDVAFVGRLVSDKGADVLLKALALIAPNYSPSLTIIGDGPERATLQAQAKGLGMDDRVSFVGAKSQPEVAEILRQHRILVVPSTWEEPFGIVALEGMACGCMVIGSNGGGLPEAIGPAGITFQRGNATDLATKLQWLLDDWSRACPFQAQVSGHLARHHPTAVAAEYLRVIREAVL